MKKAKNNPGKFKRYISKIIKIIKMPEIGVIPGQLAFYMLLSLVPLISLACYAANIFEFDYQNIVVLLDNFVPGGIGYYIPSITSGTLSLSYIVIIIWMLYIASNGCNTIILISNDIYGIKQSTWVRRRIKALFMTLLIVIFVIGLLLLSTYQVKTQAVINGIENSSVIMHYYNILQYPISVLLLFIFLRILYNFAPDRMRKSAHVNVGTIIATIGFCIVTEIYKLIAIHMSSYEILYGGLANVALLMIWLYFISYIFVIGLALNYGDEIEEENK